MTDRSPEAEYARLGRRAMILAAGHGNRMRPLTITRPKPLVEVAGRPLIDHVIARLCAAGVELAVVNVHYLADLIEAHLSAVRSPDIVVSNERDTLLDTGGGVARALPLLGDQPFFVINSDSIWIEGTRPALERLRLRWDDGEMDALLLMAATDAAEGYDGRGDFHMDAAGRLVRRGANDRAPFAYAGAMLVHPRLFVNSPKGAFSLNIVWDRCLAKRRLFGLCHDGTWLHVGTPEAIVAAERALARG